MEKIQLVESLSADEKQTIYTMLDAFVGKLKDALNSCVFSEVK